MAFSCQMHDHVDVVPAQQIVDDRGVADIGVHEAVIGMVLDLAERFEIAGIGQLVDIDDVMAGIAA